MINIFGTNKNQEKDKEKDKEKNIVDDGKLLLRKEEMDIAKNKAQIGEVEIGKEIIEEIKVVDVPVTHEEVVIERMSIDNEPTDSPIGDEETIRIPVSEERVEVGKHTVVTGEVSAKKRETVENRKVEEALKKEEARVRKEGEPNIVNENQDNPLQ